MVRDFEYIKNYLLNEECTTSTYDDKSFTVLEFATFENALTNFGYKETDMTSEQKNKIAEEVQKKFKFADIKVSEDYYLDFDFTLLKEDVNCNLNYILNAIHCFHDTFLSAVKNEMQNTKVLATV